LVSFTGAKVQWNTGECKIHNPETNRDLYLDFVVEYQNKLLAIEVDGEQHFADSVYFRSLAKYQQARDAYKMLVAWDRGWAIVRLHTSLVADSGSDWKLGLKWALENTPAGDCTYLSSWTIWCVLTATSPTWLQNQSAYL
jgi:hypothetical protein